MTRGGKGLEFSFVVIFDGAFGVGGIFENLVIASNFGLVIMDSGEEFIGKLFWSNGGELIQIPRLEWDKMAEKVVERESWTKFWRKILDGVDLVVWEIKESNSSKRRCVGECEGMNWGHGCVEEWD